jgi:hypothetical protein
MVIGGVEIGGVAVVKRYRVWRYHRALLRSRCPYCARACDYAMCARCVRALYGYARLRHGGR